MDDFDDRARRAGEELNQSVIDLVPTVAPAPSKSKRRVTIAVAVAAVITAGIFVIADRGHGGDRQVLAQVPSTTTLTAASALAHYLPRWLPDGFHRVSTVVDTVCLAGSTAASTTPAASPVPAPAVNDTNGCPTDSWVAVFIATSSAGIAPQTILLVGNTDPPPMRQGETVTVHGQPALLANPVISKPDHWTLSWAEPDLNLTMTGTGVSSDDMLRTANSVERVDDSEWNQPPPPLSGAGPSAITESNLANATEVARLTTTSGQLVRLLSLTDGLCIDAGNIRGCSGGPDQPNAPPQGTALLKMSTGTATQRYGAILLPPGLPTEIALRRSTGETVQSALSSDGHYLLFADASPPGAQYDIIDSTGQILARVTTGPFTCPPSIPTTIPNCIPPTTTLR